MKLFHKILCLVVVATVLLSVFCISSSANGYSQHNTPYFNGTYYDGYVGVPLFISSQVGYGSNNGKYYLTMDDFSALPYSVNNPYSFIPTVPDLYHASLRPNVKTPIIKYNTPSTISTDSEWYDKRISYSCTIYGCGTAQYETLQSSMTVNQAVQHIVENTNTNLNTFSATRSGIGQLAFSYLDIVSKVNLQNDHYYSTLPAFYDASVFTDDSMYNENTHTYNLQYLNSQEFKFNFQWQDCMIDENGIVEWVDREYTFYVTPSHATDYVRYSVDLSTDMNVLKTAYDQLGFGVDIIKFTYNLRRVYHTIASQSQSDYLRNIVIEIEPLLYNRDATAVNGIWFPEVIRRGNVGGVPLVKGVLRYENVIGNSVERLNDEFEEWLIKHSAVTKVYQSVSLKDFNLTDWLGNTLEGVMSVNIIGTIDLRDILLVSAGIGLLFFILKMFVGG